MKFNAKSFLAIIPEYQYLTTERYLMKLPEMIVVVHGVQGVESSSLFTPT